MNRCWYKGIATYYHYCEVIEDEEDQSVGIRSTCDATTISNDFKGATYTEEYLKCDEATLSAKAIGSYLCVLRLVDDVDMSPPLATLQESIRRMYDKTCSE